MDTLSETIQLNELTIPVTRSKRRKSVGITVNRDGSVEVAAPIICEMAKIEGYVRSRSLWIYQKLAKREALVDDRTVTKEFVDGASFFYLGQSFRLKLVDRPTENLALIGERFLLSREHVDQAAEVFRKWYVARGREVVARLAESWVPRIATPSAIDVRDIGFRWGSCTPDGKILVSWRALQLPPAIVEYVVAHEMSHLNFPSHDRDFWEMMEKVMPDFADRKDWLAKNGQSYAAEF
jgi:predicted metal-dependent hydrolase